MSSKTLLGAYIGTPGDSGSPWQSDLSSFTSAMGQAPAMVDVYVAQDSWSDMVGSAQYSASELQSTGDNFIPDVGIPMATAADSSADSAFQAIISGQYDSVFEGIFQAYAAVSKTIYIRPGWEMNGGWYPWTVTPSNASDFIAAFQHIAALAHSFSGATIKVVWSPNAAGTTVDYNSMYPGDQAVDKIGIDTYGAAIGTPDSYVFSTSGYSATTAAEMAVAHNKPLGIEETGDTAADTPTFAADLAQAITAVKGVQVANVNIWNDPSGSGSGSLLWATDSAASAAWKQAFATIAASSSSGNSGSGSTPTASPNGTKITSASGAPIIDQSGNSWTLVQSASEGLQIAINGVVDQPTQQVVLLETLNGAMVQENSSGAWYSETQPNDSWAQIANPNPPPPPAAVSVGSGSDTLMLSISEDAYANGDGTSDAAGDAAFTVSMDGKQLAGTFYAQASHAAGQDQTFTFNGDWAPGSHTVAVDFLNDAWGGTTTTDRNLYVDGVTYDGTNTNQSAALMSSGTQNFTVTDTTAIPAAPVGSGSDTLVLDVSEDAYLGNAKFTVSVDGKQLGGTFTATTLHSSGSSQPFTFKGDFGTGNHTVTVDFLNDAYGGKPSLDRNLYVNDVVYNGTDTHRSLNLYANGAKSLSVSGGTNPGVTETGDHGSLQENLSQTGTYHVGSDTFVLSSGNAVSATLGTGTAQVSFLGAGSVTLTGGSGQATVTADMGNNSFTAGAGSLDVKGGSGKDAYVLHASSGSLTMEDFSLAKGDTLTIDKSLQASLHEASDGKGGLLLSFGSNSSQFVDVHGVGALPASNITWA